MYKKLIRTKLALNLKMTAQLINYASNNIWHSWYHYNSIRVLNIKICHCNIYWNKLFSDNKFENKLFEFWLVFRPLLGNWWPRSWVTDLCGYVTSKKGQTLLDTYFSALVLVKRWLIYSIISWPTSNFSRNILFPWLRPLVKSLDRGQYLYWEYYKLQENENKQCKNLKCFACNYDGDSVIYKPI